jgi:hypothetical protein
MGEGVHELERLTARQLQQLIEGGISTAVVPFGSVEHHGGHLPPSTRSGPGRAVGRTREAGKEPVKYCSIASAIPG